MLIQRPLNLHLFILWILCAVLATVALETADIFYRGDDCNPAKPKSDNGFTSYAKGEGKNHRFSLKEHVIKKFDNSNWDSTSKVKESALGHATARDKADTFMQPTQKGSHFTMSKR
ncbi:hypothetical protein PspLS_10682 [Pyricularia sp. CBS 133598]|nr:hypothetical protein PspLS_10682 [Pyricularia sp. CBS 133598]